jgi:hypothetical protein
MSSHTPESLAEAVLACVQAYATANQGSDEHPLGHVKAGPLKEILPALKDLESVKGGFGVSLKDGSLFLVNVHRIPGPSKTTP